jgi:two-component system cell cycle sensor histidine kinase/response regulator CckA
MGHGTMFTIYLPRHEGNAGQAARTVVSGEPRMHGHETVLLVEDDPSLLKLTARMIEKHGYTVLVASTPGEALHLTDEYGDKIRLLMTDVVMPGMNGRDLAKNLLDLIPNLKLLFMSGYTADVIAHNGVLDEGVHFIQKPFSVQSLATKLREALDSV